MDEAINLILSDLFASRTLSSPSRVSNRRSRCQVKAQVKSMYNEHYYRIDAQDKLELHFS